MNFVAGFSGIRDMDLGAETTLKAQAVGDIAITELTGSQKVDSAVSAAGSVTLKAPDGSQTVDDVTAAEDVTLSSGGEMKIQHITAGGRADLTAQGSILDNRDAGDTRLNVDAASGSITSAKGSIGGDAEHRIDVSIDGQLTTDSYGDTNLNAFGSLKLTADTTEGFLHVDSTGDLTIENTRGDLHLGAIEAAGDVSITAQGGLVLGDSLGRDAQVKGENISLTAENGNLGTEEKPLRVDTNPDGNGDPGVLNAAANNGSVFITEISGDMTIGSITSTGEENRVSLKTEDGSIVESDKGSSDLIKDAVDAAIEAARAQAKAEALEDQRQALINYVNMVNCWQYRTLIDEPTGIRVSGWMCGKTELLISYDFEHDHCLICKYLEKLPASLVLYRYHISMTGRSHGMLYVQIPVDEAMEGQIVTIAYCVDGKLMAIQVEVKDGFVSFFVDELHNFVILDGQYHVVTEGEHQMLASDETEELLYVDGLFEPAA